ncbi:MAG TPA: SGNH/GDSL hydrolase family protein [Clostridia bacterium]|nr:SGNH/GDSL hydrolase family protein [Clostridia bacterium]
MKKIKKVLILGNSITRHGPLPEIGWPYNWGMAASSIENDFVHVLMGYIREAFSDAETMFFNIAGFERDFPQTEYEGAEHAIEVAKQWRPDTIVLRIGENVDDEKAPENNFGKYYEGLIERLIEPSGARVFCVNSFWRKKYVNDIMKSVADKMGLPYVDITPLGDDPANKAIGLFEHKGVADHPGDLGMKRIADAIWDAIKKDYNIKR